MIQYCQDVNSSKLVLIPNPASYFILFCVLTADSEVYIEKEKAQNSQHRIKREKQCQRTDTTLLQALLYSYSNQDTVILVKKYADE